MPTFLQQAQDAQARAGLSGRRLCRRLGFSRATFGRWRRRQRCGEPLLRTPGPPKTGPLPLAQVRQQIEQLEHGPRRTRGTGALYQQHRDGLSRRQLNAWVREERQRLQQEHREHLAQITWHDAQTAWAMDSTEWPTSRPGVKLQVLVARDLATQYSLGCQADTHLGGDQVAAFVAELVRHYGPPLFLKRDNGAVLHTPAVGRVLATAAIVPLDSPAYYPRYNGAMEKQIGDLKHLFPFALPCLSPDLGFARSVLEGLRLEFNTRRRPGLGDCSRAELFNTGPRYRADRLTRHAIFDSLYAAAWRTVQHMPSPDQRTFASAWRHAAEEWLGRHSLISVRTLPQKQTQKQRLLPLCSQKWSH